MVEIRHHLCLKLIESLGLNFRKYFLIFKRVYDCSIPSVLFGYFIPVSLVRDDQ